MDNDLIFQPLKFRNLTVKNRLFRSSISGRWDNYDGSGTQTRINWEESFARKVGEAVHRHDCRYILQLSHSGRQRDNPGVENFKEKALSSTNRSDTFHGLLCEAMTLQQIRDTIRHFADGAR